MLINNKVVSTTFFCVEQFNSYEKSATVGNTLHFEKTNYDINLLKVSILIILVSFLCRLSN